MDFFVRRKYSKELMWLPRKGIEAYALLPIILLGREFMTIMGNQYLHKFAIIAASLIFSLIFLTIASCLASDLPHMDPDRKAILDAARPNSQEFPGEKFIVKSLVKDGDWAYLCALIEENGYKDISGYLHKSHGIQGTDDQLDVHRIILNRKNEHWTVLNDGGGFASTERDVDCRSNSGKVMQNSADIREFLNSLTSPSQ